MKINSRFNCIFHELFKVTLCINKIKPPSGQCSHPSKRSLSPENSALSQGLRALSGAAAPGSAGFSLSLAHRQQGGQQVFITCSASAGSQSSEDCLRPATRERQPCSVEKQTLLRADYQFSQLQPLSQGQITSQSESLLKQHQAIAGNGSEPASGAPALPCGLD